MKITKVYTKTGDGGTTSLVGGVKVRKTNSRIEAYGTVDELYLATDKTKTQLAPSYTLDAGEIDVLEKEIDSIVAEIPPQTDFILPGGSHVAAYAHVCRTVCRRAERRIFFLAESTELDPEVLQYMNRLSDYLFVLARKLNFIVGVREKTWRKSCK